MNMRTLALRSIRANPVRFVATVLAVVVATGFLAGTLILRDSLGVALAANARYQLEGVDVGVVQYSGAPVPAPGTGTAGTPAPGTGTPGTAGGTSLPANPAAGPGRSREASSNVAPAGGGRMREVGVNTNLPAAALGTVKAVPGVQSASGILSGLVGVLDAQGDSVAENIQGSLWIDTAQLNPFRLAEGRAPTGAGEVALDVHTADKGGLHVGDRTSLATPSGAREATVVGTVTYGDRDSSGDGDVLVNPADAFTWLNNGRAEYNAVYAVAASGVAPADLVSRVSQALGADYAVQTGDELRDEASGGVLQTVATTLANGLTGFAVFTLIVSVLIIYNTFAIVVTQRTREFALLRALGARGGQVWSSVLVESVLLGVLASVLGYVVGIGIFVGLTRAVPQFQDLAGTVRFRFSPFPVLVVLVLGTMVTALSALVPAWRAARTKPLEALRDVAIDRSANSRPRAVIGLVLLGIGVALLLVGALGGNFWLMLAGLPALFLGVVVGGPVLAAAFGSAVHALVRPLRRPTLRLGVDNVRRNPRRAAITALALVIGVFMVVVVTAGGGAVRDYAAAQLSQFSGPDATVYTLNNGFPEGYVDQVRRLEGVTGVAEVYANVGFVNLGLPLSGVDFADAKALGLSLEQGKLEGLGPDEVILPSLLAQQSKLGLGDRVRVRFLTGEERELRVGAVAKASLTMSAYVSAATLRSADPAVVPSELDVTAESGRVQAVTDELTRLTRPYSGMQVAPANFLVQAVKTVFNFLIAAVNGLLSLVVLIALFGIVNTLVLSTSERTREIGLLRAVGMTRRQLGATIRLESLLVALLGALVGVGFGLFVAWCLTRPILQDEGLVGAGTTGFSWPVSQLALILVLAVVLGIVASVVPAWRAARLDVLDAVTVE